MMHIVTACSLLNLHSNLQYRRHSSRKGTLRVKFGMSVSKSEVDGTRRIEEGMNEVDTAEVGCVEEDYISVLIILHTLEYFHSILHNLEFYISEASCVSFFRCKPVWWSP
jgi:hypothetical protein